MNLKESFSEKPLNLELDEPNIKKKDDDPSMATSLLGCLYVVGIPALWYPIFCFAWSQHPPRTVLDLVCMCFLVTFASVVWPLSLLLMLLDWMSNIPLR